MKIFLDTASLKEIKEAASLGVVDGVTTNPTLLAKESGDPEAILVEICNTGRPISAEVQLPTPGHDPRGRHVASLHRTSSSRSPVSLRA